MFNIKRGDTSPVLQVTLQTGPDANPVAIDLSTATVAFHMRDSAGVLVVNVPAVVIDAPNGVVQHRWTLAHTATGGYFYAEFEVTFADLAKETFPNSGNIPVAIIGDVA